MKRLRHSEIKYLVQGHTTRSGRAGNQTPASLAPETVHLTTMLFDLRQGTSMILSFLIFKMELIIPIQQVVSGIK